MTEIVRKAGALAPASAATPTAQVVGMFLHGRPASTRRAYEQDLEGFFVFVARAELGAIGLGLLQEYADSLAASGLAPSTQTRKLAAVKSLFTFATKIGLLQFNPAAVLRLPKVTQKLAPRILSPSQVLRLVELEPEPRNFALLALLYGGGLRVAEAVALTWGDLEPRAPDMGQCTVTGKGAKVRVVLLNPWAWAKVRSIKPLGAPADAPIFESRQGGPLNVSQAHRIFKAAAARAGLPKEASPHWLRHAHASHALERGATVTLVKDTLGHASIATTDRYLHARPDQSSSTYLPI